MVNQKSGMLNSPIYIEEQPELVRSGASQATQVNVVPKNQVFSKVDVMTETMHVELERNLNEVVAEVKALNNEEKSGMLNSPIYIEEQPELVRSGASQATQVNVVPKNQVFSKVDVMTETMHVELERNLNEVVAEVKALNNEE
ncbi:unnamed protein product, partial [Ilex paraguariensis]